MSLNNLVSIEGYYKIKKKLLADRITLVAVSKTQTDESILKLYSEGQKIFGENRVQELAGKYERLPKDIEWHMIGHLQRNKVKYIAPFVSMIQSVDSIKLLREIDKEAEKCNRKIPCLLQFHIASEENKFGLDIDEATDLLENHLNTMLHIELHGVMGMASFTENDSLIRKEFVALKSIFSQLKTKYFADNEAFSIVSMGMSGDYELAIECGSNMVRLGSILFGKRN